MKRIERPQVERRLDALRIGDYLGLNLSGAHSTLLEGELKTASNVDLFPGYQKSRRGSASLNGTANKLGAFNVLNAVHWDTGAKEYALLQVASGGNSAFYSLELASGKAFAAINRYDGAALTLAGSTTPAAMFVSGSRCYVFSSVGNLAIDYDSAGSIFKGRALGLSAPTLANAGLSLTAGAGGLEGKWTYGLELVYRRNGADFLSSGICRTYANGQQATLDSAGSSATKITLTAAGGSFSLPAGIATNSTTTGICVRVWRSKNQYPDLSDPANPIDAQGVPDELYPLALLTYSAFSAAGFAYEDVNLGDAVLPLDTTTSLPVADLNYIGLSPLPSAATGVYHRSRIWVANAASVDPSQANLYYSNLAGTAYAESYTPLQVVLAEPGDGQQTISLVSFERDLIAIKESKTGRVQDGNPDFGFETLDHSIGVPNQKLARYIPGLGLAAITNDQGDFKVFGYDLRWRNDFGGQDISRKIRSATQAMAAAPTYCSFLYGNGKLFIGDGTGVFYLLHVEQGRGWTTYSYPMTNKAQAAIAFAGGTRFAVFSASTYAVEIETSATTDINTSDDSTQSITGGFTTHRFQVDGGRGILEGRYLSLNAQLTDRLTATPYVNGKLWPNDSANPTPFTPDPNVYSNTVELKEREYQAFFEDRLVGSHIHFLLQTIAPFIIRDTAFFCISQTGANTMGFDPFQTLGFRATAPAWAARSLLLLEFAEASGVRAYDSSGNARHHDFATSAADTSTYTSTLIPYGGRAIVNSGGVSGYSLIPGATFPIAETGIGQAAGGGCAKVLTFKLVDTFPKIGTADTTIIENGDGTDGFRLRVLTNGSAEFRWFSASHDYTFTTAAGAFVVGSAAEFATKTQTLIFVLSNSGLNGQFYGGLITGDIQALTTTRSGA